MDLFRTLEFANRFGVGFYAGGNVSLSIWDWCFVAAQQNRQMRLQLPLQQKNGRARPSLLALAAARQCYGLSSVP